MLHKPIHQSAMWLKWHSLYTTLSYSQQMEESLVGAATPFAWEEQSILQTKARLLVECQLEASKSRGT